MGDALNRVPPGVDLCKIPIGEPPEGVEPNFVNPETLQAPMIAVSVITLVLTSIIHLGRLYINKGHWKIADYAMTFALAFHYVLVAIGLWRNEYYRHLWDIPLCWLAVRWRVKTALIAAIPGFASFFAKLAIFLFYLQTFSINNAMRIGSYIGIALNFLTYFPTSFATLYYNVPRVGETWKGQLSSSRNQEGIPIGVAIGVLTVVLDIYIFVLPLPCLLRLNLARRKRFQLVGLFATAMLGIVAGVVALYFRIRLLEIPRRGDASWLSGLTQITMIIENCVAIMVGSLPAFAHFLRVYVGNSSWVRSLLSGFGENSTKETSKNEAHASPRETLWTIGGGPRQKKRSMYHELSEVGGQHSQAQITSYDREAPAV